jgi:hypothetical protein
LEDIFNVNIVQHLARVTEGSQNAWLGRQKAKVKMIPVPSIRTIEPNRTYIQYRIHLLLVNRKTINAMDILVRLVPMMNGANERLEYFAAWITCSVVRYILWCPPPQRRNNA